MQQDTKDSSQITLGHLRAAAKMSGREVIDKMRQYSDKSPKHVSTVLKLEAKGTDDLQTLQAYAFAISSPLNDVLRANQNTKDGATRFDFPRGRKKKTTCVMN